MATNHEVRGSNPLRCDNLLIKIFAAGPLFTNAILVGCLDSHRAVIIDVPYGSSGPLIDALEKDRLELQSILLTHSHWDHIGDLALLKKLRHVPLCLHLDDEKNVRNPGSDKLSIPFPIDGVVPDRYLVEGEKIEIGSLEMEVIHTPGHTPGSVLYWIAKKEILISGDTLFKGSIGRVDLPTSSPFQMKQSIKTLLKFSHATRVIPGHGEMTTIGNELPMLSKMSALL